MKQIIGTKIMVTMIFVFLMAVPLISAQETLGVFKQNQCVELTQTCASCSYINFTKVTYPDSTIALGNVEATKIGSVFNYSFCNTTQLGNYKVWGIGDVDGTDTVFAYDFDVTVNGKEPAEGIVIVVFVILFLVVFFFGLLYFFKALGHVLELNMDIIDTVVLVGTYLTVFFFYYFSMEYLGNAMINDILEIVVTVGAFTHVLLPLIGFLVSFIMTNLKFKKKSRITY